MTSSIPRPEGSGERSRRSASPKLRCARKQSRAGPSVKGLDTSTQIGGLRIMKRYLGRRSEQVAAASADTRSSLFNARGEATSQVRAEDADPTPGGDARPAGARSVFVRGNGPSVSPVALARTIVSWENRPRGVPALVAARPGLSPRDRFGSPRRHRIRCAMSNPRCRSRSAPRAIYDRCRRRIPARGGRGCARSSTTSKQHGHQPDPSGPGLPHINHAELCAVGCR